MVDFNWKLVNFNRVWSSSFNQNPILVVRFESNQIQQLNLDGLDSKSSMIQFVSPNCQSLLNWNELEDNTPKDCKNYLLICGSIFFHSNYKIFSRYTNKSENTIQI